MKKKNGLWTHQTIQKLQENWNGTLVYHANLHWIALLFFLALSPFLLCFLLCSGLLPSSIPSNLHCFCLSFMCSLSLCHLAPLDILFLFKSKLLYLKNNKMTLKTTSEWSCGYQVLPDISRCLTLDKLHNLSGFILFFCKMKWVEVGDL